MEQSKNIKYPPTDGGTWECNQIHILPNQQHQCMSSGINPDGFMPCSCGGLYVKIEPKPKEKKSET
jgi:hypothetical protein